MTDRGASPWNKQRAHRRKEARRLGLLRRWVALTLEGIGALLVRWRGAAELRAMDERELHDLGLDRAGIVHAARYGRDEGRIKPEQSSALGWQNRGRLGFWRHPASAQSAQGLVVGGLSASHPNKFGGD